MLMTNVILRPSETLRVMFEGYEGKVLIIYPVISEPVVTVWTTEDPANSESYLITHKAKINERLLPTVTR